MRGRKSLGDGGEIVATEKGPIIVSNEPKSPMCDMRFLKYGACLMAKAKFRIPSVLNEVRVQPEMLLKQGDLTPGQCVSCDHYESRTLGCHPTTFGKDSDHLKYKGGALYVDHASSWISNLF